LNPHCATAQHWLGVYYTIRGRFDEAKAALRCALAIDPTSEIFLADLGQAYYFAHDYEQAIAFCKQALDLDADFTWAHKYLFYIYAKQGNQSAFFEQIAQLDRLSGADTIKTKGLKKMLDSKGFRSIYESVIKDAQATERANKIDPMLYYSAAQSSMIAGEREQALYWLRRSLESHNFTQPFVNVDPLYDDLRVDPRFQELLRRMNLTS
jgi:tetratricopeptide (TPR) repeat protein